VRLGKEVLTGVRPDDAWDGLTSGAWGGPIRFEVDGDEYAGTVRLVDVDEDERRVTIHGQARRVGGWGGVTVSFEARPAGERSHAALAIDGDAVFAGAADRAAAAALAEELEARIDMAAGFVPSPADDPAFRRKLAARAALAVAVGAAAGFAGAAWGRRRRG
jgi:hypothetical protein